MVDFKLSAFNNNFQVCKRFRSALLVQFLQHFCRTEKTDRARFPLRVFFLIKFFFSRSREIGKYLILFLGKTGSNTDSQKKSQTMCKQAATGRGHIIKGITTFKSKKKKKKPTKHKTTTKKPRN